MGIFTKIFDVLGSSVISTVADTVKAYFPPSMSDQEKAELTLKIAEAEHSRTLQLMNAANQVEIEFNKRLQMMEGTAADLAQFGFMGRIIIFLRGCQRPFWGLGTLYIDILVFTGKITIKFTEPAQVLDGKWYPGGGWTPEGAAFVILNLLVLGFLFGERAVKNILPIILEFLHTRGLMTKQPSGGDAQ
jgi:hypothetical protein